MVSGDLGDDHYDTCIHSGNLNFSDSRDAQTSTNIYLRNALVGVISLNALLPESLYTMSLYALVSLGISSFCIYRYLRALWVRLASHSLRVNTDNVVGRRVHSRS